MNIRILQLVSKIYCIIITHPIHLYSISMSFFIPKPFVTTHCEMHSTKQVNELSHFDAGSWSDSWFYDVFPPTRCGSGPAGVWKVLHPQPAPVAAPLQSSQRLRAAASRQAPVCPRASTCYASPDLHPHQSRRHRRQRRHLHPDPADHHSASHKHRYPVFFFRASTISRKPSTDDPNQAHP